MDLEATPFGCHQKFCLDSAKHRQAQSIARLQCDIFRVKFRYTLTDR